MIEKEIDELWFFGGGREFDVMEQQNAAQVGNPQRRRIKVGLQVLVVHPGVGWRSEERGGSAEGGRGGNGESDSESLFWSWAMCTVNNNTALLVCGLGKGWAPSQSYPANHIRSFAGLRRGSRSPKSPAISYS